MGGVKNKTVKVVREYQRGGEMKEGVFNRVVRKVSVAKLHGPILEQRYQNTKVRSCFENKLLTTKKLNRVFTGRE